MDKPINLTTGPVQIEQEVIAVFNQIPVSHRSAEFRYLLEEVRKKLCLATKANDVIIMSGSGTLANEAMIAQIAKSGKHGLILSNGEFGERLEKQCCRYQMNFSILRKKWGEHFIPEEIVEMIQVRKPQWLLFCNHETSTGVVNDLPFITKVCSANNIPVYADCISSVGNMEVDLSAVALASCSSGKGMAALPGLAIVFINTELERSSSIPTYLDLANYSQSDYLPFTLNSNLLSGLNCAIDKTMNANHWLEVERIAAYFKSQIRNSGYQILNERNESKAFVFSILVQYMNSFLLGESLKKEGIIIAYESNYLKWNNMVQIALMGKHNELEINYCMEKLTAIRSVLTV